MKRQISCVPSWSHENKISSSQRAPQMRALVCLCTENLCSALCPRNYRHDFYSRIVWQGTEACRKCSSWLQPMFSHCGILLIIKCSCYYYYCYRILNYSDLCNNQLTCDKRKCDVVLPMEYVRNRFYYFVMYPTPTPRNISFYLPPNKHRCLFTETIQKNLKGWKIFWACVNATNILSENQSILHL